MYTYNRNNTHSNVYYFKYVNFTIGCMWIMTTVSPEMSAMQRSGICRHLSFLLLPPEVTHKLRPYLLPRISITMYTVNGIRVHNNTGDQVCCKALHVKNPSLLLIAKSSQLFDKAHAKGPSSGILYLWEVGGRKGIGP